MFKVLSYPRLNLIDHLPVSLDHVTKLPHQLAHITNVLLDDPQLSVHRCRLLHTGFRCTNCCAGLPVRTDLIGHLISVAVSSAGRQTNAISEDKWQRGEICRSRYMHSRFELLGVHWHSLLNAACYLLFFSGRSTVATRWLSGACALVQHKFSLNVVARRHNTSCATDQLMPLTSQVTLRLHVASFL